MRLHIPGKFRTRQFLLLQGLLVASGVVVRWPTLSFPLTEAHAFRQTQTTLMIREFMASGLGQISPLPLFGPPWQVPMEFPLFQAVAAILGQAIGTTPQIAGRVTALLFFQIAAILTAYLAYRWFSPAGSVISLVLFEFLPFGFQWGSAPLIEFVAVSGALGAIVCIERWRHSFRSPWLVAAGALLSCAMLVKPTTAVVWVPLYLLITIDWSRRPLWSANRHRWPAAIPLLVATLAGCVWVLVSDVIKAASPYTEFLTSRRMVEWNFGTINQRIDTGNWRTIAGYSDAIVGSLLIAAALTIVALIVWERRDAVIGLALALPVGATVFFNLYYMHNYYQAAVFPALVLLLGGGSAGLVRLPPPGIARPSVATLSVTTILFAAWISDEGQLVSARTSSGLYTFPLAEEIAASTPEGAGVLMVGCDWDPTYLYLSGRRGLMVRSDALDEAVPPQWIGNELEYLALCDHAIDMTRLWPLNLEASKVSENLYRIDLPR